MTTRNVEVTSKNYGDALAKLKGTDVAEILEGFGKQAADVFGHIGTGAVLRQATVTIHQMSEESPGVDRLRITDAILKPVRERAFSARTFSPDLAWVSLELMNQSAEKLQKSLERLKRARAFRAGQLENIPG